MNLGKRLEKLEEQILPKNETYTIQTSDGEFTLTRSKNVAEDIKKASEEIERKSLLK